MARKIRLVFGACFLPIAQLDPKCKLQLMRVYELSTKCGSVGPSESAY